MNKHTKNYKQWKQKIKDRVSYFGVVLSCRVIAHVIVSPRNVVPGWISVTDRELSHLHGFSAKVRVTLTDEWPDDFHKVGIVTLTLTSRVTESWIFYVSGLAILLVGMTGRRVTGRHRRTGTASYIYSCDQYEYIYVTNTNRSIYMSYIKIENWTLHKLITQLKKF